MLLKKIRSYTYEGFPAKYFYSKYEIWDNVNSLQFVSKKWRSVVKNSTYVCHFPHGNVENIPALQSEKNICRSLISDINLSQVLWAKTKVNF